MIGLMPFLPPSGGPALTLFSDTTGTTYPAGLQNGDIGVLLEGYYAGGATTGVSAISPPAGFTAIVNASSAYSTLGPGQNAEPRYYRHQGIASQRSLTAAMSGTSILSLASTRRLLVFRDPSALTVETATMKAAETTHTYAGAVNFSAQPSPILPVFAVVKCHRSGIAAPALTFDGASPAFYDLAWTGVAVRLGLLMGQQPPRSISVNLSDPGAEFTGHAMFNIRRPLT